MYSYRSLLSPKLKTFLRLESFQKSRTKKRPLLLARSVATIYFTDTCSLCIYRTLLLFCLVNLFFNNFIYRIFTWNFSFPVRAFCFDFFCIVFMVLIILLRSNVKKHGLQAPGTNHWITWSMFFMNNTLETCDDLNKPWQNPILLINQ